MSHLSVLRKPLGPFCNMKMQHSMASARKIIHYSGEDRIEGLLMPKGDPRDRLFYPILTLMVDSHNILKQQKATTK